MSNVSNVSNPAAPPRFHPIPLLLAAITALCTLLALAGVALWQRWLPAALWHLVFAVGALPLILGTMIYFTPVLTRTPEALRRLAAIPLTALAAGLAIVAWFVEGGDSLRDIAPWLALGAVVALAAWMTLRRRACLGRVHAGLAWYAAALFCLALGLIAVGVSTQWPAAGPTLRAFHIHINTLGFMGLTAIGTLQVLLPTVLNQPDPAAPARLRRDLPWGLAGALAIALGAAGLGGGSNMGIALASLTSLGSLAYAWPVLRIGLDSRRAYGPVLWLPRQAAPLLLAAMAGLALILLHGIAHGAGWVRARDVLPLFVIGFLLPLVSGAVSQLLPVWLRPGAQAEWHRTQRAAMADFARSRAALLFCAGLLCVIGDETSTLAGYVLGMLGALWLIGLMARTVLRALKPQPQPQLKPSPPPPH